MGVISQKESLKRCIPSCAVIIYILGTVVMVGVIPLNILSGDLTPVATASGIIFGKVGTVFVTIAALMAFLSVANAGTLSASRYPLAMSRDHMLPRLFQKIGMQGTPFVAILLTVAMIVVILVIASMYLAPDYSKF